MTRWVLVPYEPEPRCESRRAKNGKVCCERPADPPHDDHAARDVLGRWHSWKEKQGD